MADTTVGHLIERVTKAQRNLGPRNPYRLLLAECLAVIRFLGDELVKAKHAQNNAAAVVGDRGTGSVDIVRIEDGTGSGDHIVGDQGVPVDQRRSDDHLGAVEDAGYGHGV